MNRWKASLGLNAGEPIGQPNDPKCVIQSLALVVDGRPDVVIDLSTQESRETLKNKPFTIKEGAKFKIKVTFQVNHEVLSGLKYVHAVKRKGIRVSKDEEMLGSYAPSTTEKPIYEKLCTYCSHPTFDFSYLINNPQQSKRRKHPLACSPAATTTPCLASSMMTTTSSWNLNGLSTSLRTGNREDTLGPPPVLNSLSGLLLSSVTNFLDTKSLVEMVQSGPVTAQFFPRTHRHSRAHTQTPQPLSRRNYRVDFMFIVSIVLHFYCLSVLQSTLFV